MQVLARVEVRRLGRAVEALVSGQYRWQQVAVVAEGAVVRGYVQHMQDSKLHKEYAVQLAADGSQGWCSCRDHFVGGYTCKHIILAALVIAQQAAAAKPADNKLYGVRRPQVAGT